MKNLSLIAVLTAFLTCGFTLGAHARDVEKIARQGQVSVEIPNETESWHNSEILLVSRVPKSIAEEESAKEQCTVTLEVECPDGTTVIATASGETCAEAGARAGGMIDTGCSRPSVPN